jgi:hypothetical protein
VHEAIALRFADEGGFEECLGERQELVYLPLPPGEGWGEGVRSGVAREKGAITPAPLPEGEGRNTGAARLTVCLQSLTLLARLADSETTF